jgi:hypothetical protein
MSVAQLPLVIAPASLLKVTSLDPRTPHQPEKLQKLSKNNCVLHHLFFRSTKKTKLHVLWIQWSAARSQGTAAKMVQARDRLNCWKQFYRNFWDGLTDLQKIDCPFDEFTIVKIVRESAQDKGFAHCFEERSCSEISYVLITSSQKRHCQRALKMEKARFAPPLDSLV